jgi:imidazole glycerol-phosphate synthase subunit HisF
MHNIRLIPRLDIKGPYLIKGVHLEGLRKIGDPGEFARHYYKQGADELIYVDVVASLYGRNNLLDIVTSTAQHVFIPMTVGGGIRSVDDVQHLLRAGADKVSINTAALQNPALLPDIANAFGTQCLVVEIQAKRQGNNSWEALADNGREHSGKDAIIWAQEAVARGAGELLITSIDQEGTRRGFDVALMRAIAESVSVPVIASGGMGQMDHLVDVIKEGKVDAVAIADMLHYKRADLSAIREAAQGANIPIRELAYV